MFYLKFSVSLSQMSNRTVRVAGTLSGNIVLAERLNYEERTRYLIIVQANVRYPSLSYYVVPLLFNTFKRSVSG